MPFAGPKRLQAPALSAALLPRLDLLMIPHNHYDHLNEASVLALNAQAGGPPRFLVPLGVGSWMKGKGIQASQIIELDWWDELTPPGTEVTVALSPVPHWSARSPSDRMKMLWGGFVVFGPDIAWAYMGDTGYSRDFQDIRARYSSRLGAQGFALALIPIGAYEPRWFMRDQHVNPEESVRIQEDLGSKLSIGVHWGTHQLTDEPIDQPPLDLAKALAVKAIPSTRFRVLAIGETTQIPRRSM